MAGHLCRLVVTIQRPSVDSEAPAAVVETVTTITIAIIVTRVVIETTNMATKENSSGSRRGTVAFVDRFNAYVLGADRQTTI